MGLKHKFHAVKCEYDGFSFPSKKEGNDYLKLKLLKDKGEVVTFLRQVPLHLPGGVKLVVDWLVFWTNGDATFADTKGMKTPIYIAKKKIAEAYHGITIEEW
jgi:hypothetical protein